MKNNIQTIYNYIITLIKPEYVNLKNDTIIMSKDTFKQLNYIQNLNYHSYDDKKSILSFYKVDKNSSSIEASCNVQLDKLGNIKIIISEKNEQL